MSTSSIIPEKSTEIKTLNYLKDYLKAGFNVIPLREKSKAPAVKWRSLIKKPMTADELEKFYKKNPKLNIGLIAGPSSNGLVIIDVDHQAPEKLVFLLAENPTVTVQTSRGRHYFYRSEKKLPNLNFDWGELRADGVYVMAPPSIHPNGSRYEFLNDCELDEIVDLPDTILEFLTTNANEDRQGVSSEVFTKKEIYTFLGNPGMSRENSYSFLGKEELLSTYKNQDIAFRLLGLCGCKVSNLGVAFKCPIHKDARASVSLWKDQSGVIVLHEFHNSEKEFTTLPELYASFVIGKPTYFCLKKGNEIKNDTGVMAIWWLRALEDVGFIKTIQINAPELPPNVNDSIKRIYYGFVRLLQLRKFYDENQNSALYSWGFAKDWCQLSKPTVQKAMQWLFDNGYLKIIEPAKKHGLQKAALIGLGGKK